MTNKPKSEKEIKYNDLMSFIKVMHSEIEKILKKNDVSDTVGDLIFALDLDGIYEDRFLNDKSKVMQLLEILIFHYVKLKEYVTLNEEKIKKIERKKTQLQKENERLKKEIMLKK